MNEEETQELISASSPLNYSDEDRRSSAVRCVTELIAVADGAHGEPGHAAWQNAPSARARGLRLLQILAEEQWGQKAGALEVPRQYLIGVGTASREQALEVGAFRRWFLPAGYRAAPGVKALSLRLSPPLLSALARSFSAVGKQSLGI